MKILIVSDGKKGHENQSIAYALLLGAEYEIVQIRFKSRWHKALSYLFDWLGFYTTKLFEPFTIDCSADRVVGAGSGTYYAVKLIAKRCNIPAIALMQPKGYRKNFAKIYAQYHDGGDMPINFSYSQPQGHYRCDGKCIALIVGGSNRIYSMQKEEIEKVADFIFSNFSEYKKLLTTSPRTPKEIEEYLEELPFDYTVIFSKNPINPIGDFLACCEYVFITIDSTSMISEAISSGKAAIEVVPLQAKRENKYQKMVEHLEDLGALHIFDGNVAKANKKIDLKRYL